MMRNRHSLGAAGRRGPGWWITLLALVVAFAGAGMAGRGGGGNPPPGDPGDGGGGPPNGGAMDEEAIGSLPSMGGGFLLFSSPGAPAPDLPPSFYVVGPTERIVEALIGAQGSGHVSLHPAPGRGRCVAILYGAIHVALDATLFTDPAVEAGLVVGVDFGHVAAGMFYEGRLLTRAVIEPRGCFQVPVGELFELGLLKDDGVSLFIASPRAGRRHVRLNAFGGLVSLDQMN